MGKMVFLLLCWVAHVLTAPAPQVVHDAAHHLQSVELSSAPVSSHAPIPLWRVFQSPLFAQSKNIVFDNSIPQTDAALPNLNAVFPSFQLPWSLVLPPIPFISGGGLINKDNLVPLRVLTGANNSTLGMYLLNPLGNIGLPHVISAFRSAYNTLMSAIPPALNFLGFGRSLENTNVGRTERVVAGVPAITYDELKNLEKFIESYQASSDQPPMMMLGQQNYNFPSPLFNNNLQYLSPSMNFQGSAYRELNIPDTGLAHDTNLSIPISTGSEVPAFGVNAGTQKQSAAYLKKTRHWKFFSN